MKTISLYNNDGTLSTEAQFLLAPKPESITKGEWLKKIRNFKSSLTEEDINLFEKLKSAYASKAYYEQNKETVKARYRNSYKSNKRLYLNRSNAWYAKNKEKARSYIAEYARARRQKDPLYNFFHSIRSQAVRVVKQVGLGKKPTNTFKWVGCSPEQLKAHIESLFLEGMTWDNYGKHGWHVDHVRPVSSFKPEEWEQINHYTNLQPLWAEDNLSKSNKI